MYSATSEITLQSFTCLLYTTVWIKQTSVMLANKLSACVKIKDDVIYWLAFVCSCLSMLNFVWMKMGFPNSRAKAGFVICFTLAFEVTIFERKTIKYFV